MSQVSYSFECIPLNDIVGRLSEKDQIVVIQGPVSHKLFRKVDFPIETHFQKSEVNSYEEFLLEYAVIEIIRSTDLKVGDRFWVWEEPAYSLKDVRRFHETGLFRSPDIWKRKPEFLREGDIFIAFLFPCTSKCRAGFPIVYSIMAEEGLDAAGKIKTMIKTKEKLPSKRWWRFWKYENRLNI